MPFSEAVPLHKTPPVMIPKMPHPFLPITPLAIVATATLVSLLSKQSLFPPQDLFIC